MDHFRALFLEAFGSFGARLGNFFHFGGPLGMHLAPWVYRGCPFRRLFFNSGVQGMFLMTFMVTFAGVKMMTRGMGADPLALW